MRSDATAGFIAGRTPVLGLRFGWADVVTVAALDGSGFLKCLQRILNMPKTANANPDELECMREERHTPLRGHEAMAAAACLAGE